MKKYRQPAGFMAILVLIFALVLSPGMTGMARAASEDVAMFYDDLSQYGQWIDYENYGPVWRPSQIPEDWRPYTNGRWVPTEEGNIFESDEPWAWATYHYGNWMPTEGYGWVWVPGSTWYPSTVEWRSSPESEPIDSSYIGWAPTPPPDYVPPPAYAPPSYYQGAPVTDSLASPLWIFARAVSFLLGMNQPYSPAYSYVNSGVLVPPVYVPVFYSRTVFIPRYAAPAYYPPGFIGVRRFGVGAYNMGPSITYLSRVTRINHTVITRTIYNNSLHFNRIHNVIPPDRVLRRGGYIRTTLPPALIQGRRLPPPILISNYQMARANLNKPSYLPPPQGLPRVHAQIPRVQPLPVTPDRGLPGTALPARATMPLTPQMTQQISQLPPNQRFIPGRSQPFKPATAIQARPEGTYKPGIRPQPGQFQPGAQIKRGPGLADVPGQPGQVRPEATSPSGYLPPVAAPGSVKPGTQPSPQPSPGEFHPGAKRPGIPTRGTPATPSAAEATKPRTVPLPPGARAGTSEQRRQQELEHQRLQSGKAHDQIPPLQQQRRDQERLRQQQLQQQQRQLQERRRQQQLQEQPQRQQQIRMQQQQQERQHQLQMQQQQRQGQMQQQRQLQERQRQLQARPQPQAPPRVQAPAPRPQPQAAPRPQPQPQSQPQRNRQERGKKGQEHNNQQQ